MMGYPVPPRYKTVQQLEKTFDWSIIAQPTGGVNAGYYDVFANSLGVVGSSGPLDTTINVSSAHAIGAGGTYSNASYSAVGFATSQPVGLSQLLGPLYDSYRVFGCSIDVNAICTNLSVNDASGNNQSIAIQICVVPVTSEDTTGAAAPITFSSACSQPRAKFMTIPMVTTGRRRIGLKSFVKTSEVFGVTTRAVQDDPAFAAFGSAGAPTSGPAVVWLYRVFWAMPSYDTITGLGLQMTWNLKLRYYLEMFTTNKVITGA